MVDAIAIMKATRAGYEVYWQKDGSKEDAWFRKEGKSFGPFKTLDDAAHAALHHEEEEVLKKFWEGKEE